MFAHAQAPVRIGIAGGGTDLPVWTKDKTGYCLSLAIDSYTHAVAITRSDRQVVASYRQRDQASSATEIANGLVRESALMHGFEDGFEVHTMSEVSSLGSGLGVSSSIAVCLAAVFKTLAQMTSEKNYVLRNEGLPDFQAAAAQHSWQVEIDRLRRPIGRQDHMAAAYGGLRLYTFEKDRVKIERTFSKADAAWLASKLVLLPLPTGHDSRAILTHVKDQAQLQKAMDAVPMAISAIDTKDAPLLGSALSLGQESKTKIPGAVPSTVLEIVEKITRIANPNVPIYGLKICGAGGGGHIVIACEPVAIPFIETYTELAVQTIQPDRHWLQDSYDHLGHTGVRTQSWM